MYKNYDLDLILFGGEPTIDPHFFKILSQLKRSKYPLQIFTNLSMPLDFYKKMVTIRKDIKILGSYHYEFANNGRFLENALFLSNHINFVQIKVMWDSSYKEEIKKMYQEFKEMENVCANFNCSIDIIYHPGQKFTTEDMRWYVGQQEYNINLQKYKIRYDDGGQIIEKDISFNEIKMYCGGKANYKYFRCDCGVKNLIVCSNGDVHYCLTMRKNHRPPIFNLINDDFREHLYVLDHPIMCQEDNCYSEVCVPKERLLPDRVSRAIKCRN